MEVTVEAVKKMTEVLDLRFRILNFITKMNRTITWYVTESDGDGFS